MNPADFICGLMRRNTDALGFIPEPTIRHRFVKRGMYVIQKNRFGHWIGYIVHGPVHPDKTMHIHQACIELDRRNRGFGARAVATVIERACHAHAQTILLRCASDLEACSFWQSLGFIPTHLAPGGARRQRNLIHFKLDLTEYGA